MNTELIEELRSNISSPDLIRELSREDAKSLVNDIASRYLADRTLVWWWEGLLEKPAVVNYGEALGWDYIIKLVRSQEEKVFLVVTDDNPEPWVVLEGSLSAMVKLLENMWRFEYIVVDARMSWIIFDTHHNSLVVAGSLREQALKIA